MNIDLITLVYFSPTKTTMKILEGIAAGIGVERVERLDLTTPESAAQKYPRFHETLAVIGVPVYGGRVPLDAVDRLRKIRADGVPAVIVVVYGNRAFEDALLELKDISSEVGFRPIAGGAFIGEHSFSNPDTPIAAGRPDAEDLAKTREFGRMIWEKMTSPKGGVSAVPPLTVPGDFPYKERPQPARIVPVTLETLCTTCGTCAEVCPTAAVTVDGRVVTDADAEKVLPVKGNLH